MSASFGVVGRAQLAGYAGTASGILRSRIHPLVPIAAIDVLAVAVALGAMNLVGTIVGGQRENPFLAAIDRTKDDFTMFAVKAPMPTPMVAKASPAVAEVLAAVPDAVLLFAPPVFIGGPFEAGQGDTVRFISPVGVAATNANEPTTSAAGPATGEEPQPTDVAVVEEPLLPDPEVTDTDPQSPPVAKILSIAGRTQTRALELADQAVVAPVAKAASASVDLGGAGDAVTSITSAAVPVVAKAASTVVAPVVQAAAAPVQAVTAPVQSVAAPVVQSAAAPVQQVVQSVTQPVTQVIGGLLN